MSELTMSPLGGDAIGEPLERAYLVCGDDAELIGATVSRLRALALSDDTGEFDWDEFHAATVDAEDVLASAQRAPVSAARRFVSVEGCEVLTRAERRADCERLAEGIRALPSMSCLVLIRRTDDGAARRGAAIVTSGLDAAVREVGCVVRCRALDADGLAAWARQYAASAGKDLGLEAARRLTQSGGDRSALRNDLDKLVAYVADREAIEMADVVALTAQAPEDVMFRLVDAVSGRRAGDALLLLRRAARYEARDQTLASKLMALLGRQLRLVWQAKELAAAGVAMSGLRALPESIADALPQESSIVSLAWKANALLRDAHLWTRDELTEAFGLLVDTDAANKGEETGSSDVMANLEALIVRLCPAPARRA